MNSPYGRPSPAYLRSIHRPHPRHNAEKAQVPDNQAPETRQGPRFPSSAAMKYHAADTGASRRDLLIEQLDLTRI
jgi:hypothetical protein